MSAVTHMFPPSSVPPRIEYRFLNKHVAKVYVAARPDSRSMGAASQYMSVMPVSPELHDGAIHPRHQHVPQAHSLYRKSRKRKKGAVEREPPRVTLTADAEPFSELHSSACN